MMGGAAISVTDETFQTEVIDSAVPVLVDFWAEWCGPCKMISPVLEELAAEYAGTFKVAKVDVDGNQRTPMQFQVRSIPTLLFFKNGQLVKQMVGAYPKNKLKEEIENLLRG